MQTLPPSNQDVNGINWLPLKVLVACKLTNRFAWPDTDYRIKIADLNFPHYLPKAFEVHIENHSNRVAILTFFSKPPKDQIISKGLFVSTNSPKKRTNNFVFTTNEFVRLSFGRI